ncbi:MAG: hypothetical protein HYX69_01185 [Planctomycetia bacterium]|nr:hypothetical protein [Planctomycetia bacterium]
MPNTRTSERGRLPIDPVYFSCHRDFGYLVMSIRSLLKFGSGHIGKIFIYEDASGPFTVDERAALSSLYGDLSIVTGPRVTGWGVESVTRELTFFRHVLQALPAARRSFVAKIDSDVLFLSNTVFEHVAVCDGDLFGQPFTSASGLTYSQGGCYFISSGFLPALVHAPLSKAIGELSVLLKMPVFRLPEDASIFYLAQKLAARVRLSPYYLPHQRIPTFSPSATERASVIHFETGLGPHLRPHMARISNELRAA